MKLMHRALLTAVMCSVPTYAQAQTLDFETSGASCGGSIPNGYGGFSWNNFAAVSRLQDCRPDVAPGVVSGNWAATNVFGALSFFSGGDVFNFMSAHLSSWSTEGVVNYAPFSMTVSGWRNGSQMYTSLVNLTGTTALHNFNFRGVDQVRFDPVNDSDWFLMDDMTTNVVPEPLSLTLLGTGLLGLAGVGKLRRRKKTEAV